MERVEYDEFGLFHENAEEFGLPYDGPPTVRREFVALPDGRTISALVWGTDDPEYVFLHGGAQNAHTWDTVAMALDRPLVAIDLPGHGHSDGPNEATGGQIAPESLAADVAVAIRALAPNARGVIGMSLGGLTTIALTAVAPELVRSVVLVDVTPGVDGQKSKVIADFINGPESFPNFDELLARTIEYNPTRTESSLRRGILHNAVQRDDGSWVWRYARFRTPPAEGDAPADSTANFPRFGVLWEPLSRIKVPLMLARGMREQSVVDDADEAKLLELLPDARVEHVRSGGPQPAGRHAGRVRPLGRRLRAVTRRPAAVPAPTSVCRNERHEIPSGSSREVRTEQRREQGRATQPGAHRRGRAARSRGVSDSTGSRCARSPTSSVSRRWRPTTTCRARNSCSSWSPTRWPPTPSRFRPISRGTSS